MRQHPGSSPVSLKQYLVKTNPGLYEIAPRQQSSESKTIHLVLKQNLAHHQDQPCYTFSGRSRWVSVLIIPNLCKGFSFPVFGRSSQDVKLRNRVSGTLIGDCCCLPYPSQDHISTFNILQHPPNLVYNLWLVGYSNTLKILCVCEFL